MNSNRRRGLRGVAAAAMRRIATMLDQPATDIGDPIPSAWCEYLEWLSFAVPGMLNRGNVDAMSFALQHLPSDAPVLEIGSFCGLSACAITYLRQRHSIPNRLFTCDCWAFEGQHRGRYLGDSKIVTHDEYRDFVHESYLRNTKTFCGTDLPYTIEADSDTFFQRWNAAQAVIDVYGRHIETGGPLSFCYIDGNHTYEFAKRDFMNTHRVLVSGGFILFDDSADNSAWEVCRVVQEVLNSGSYRLVTKNPNYLVQKICPNPTPANQE